MLVIFPGSLLIVDLQNDHAHSNFFIPATEIAIPVSSADSRLHWKDSDFLQSFNTYKLGITRLFQGVYQMVSTKDERKMSERILDSPGNSHTLP